MTEARQNGGQTPRPSWIRATILIASLVTILGCGSSGKQYVAPGAPLRDHPRLAMLPLEDLTGRPEVAGRITQIFFAELVRTGACDVIDLGESEIAMREIRVRTPGSLTNEQIQRLGEELEVGFLMTGTVLEAGTIRTGDGEVPVLGVTLKLIEVTTKRVIWAAVDNRSGEDDETIFGWGREYSADRLATRMAEDMLKSINEMATPPASGEDGGSS
jgi:TolB-like protein